VTVTGRRNITVVAGCLAALVAFSALPAQASAATPRCRGADLAGAIIDVQGAAGSEFGRMILVNTSSRTCHMKGFAGAQFLDKNNQPLTTHVTRDHSTPVELVVVRRGAAGAFELRWSNVPSDAQPCAKARWVRVTPPHSSSSVRVHFGAAPCRGDLEVRAITDPSSVAGAAADAAPTLRCKSADLRYPFQPGGPKTFGVFKLRITDGECAEAHRVARAWMAEFELNILLGSAKLPRKVAGFTFTTLPPDAAQTFNERGRRGTTTIRFDYVVPNG
jgi:hypothetical protein